MHVSPPSTDAPQTSGAPVKGTRERIVEAAAALLAEGGRDAVSTRAVSAAAGVQAPAIYRQFGDMRGLLDATGSYGLASYLAEKVAMPHHDDPVDDLRAGWDLHVGFGLAQPAFYTLIFGNPSPGSEPTAARRSGEILAEIVQRVARAGRLRVSEERAAHLIHAAGRGITLSLIAMPADQRDLTLSTMARESVLATIVTPSSPSTPAATGNVASAAITLRASLPDLTPLTPGERTLLAEWLDRLTTT
ncbi:TetR/AcrR family transcriptional regulator [Catenuloplanes atrovinosus]|uniref:AcrR family transcriptional regulator n=1 Tax=Catenuloplanes atrovinosus TaxID=137266 RepID=A0AAE3YRA4_9ACTN|nr:TetR/AcrR family transcriptional regulator [Catenuloplanes atrovinosus]MDR7277792.1 AcrR family transcriptional regulator [Catenuloplanes atrovinosus]